MSKTKLPNDYFPHDFNARYDRKILRCRKVLGIEGYGIYWMLIEMLCTQENFSYPIEDIDLLADDFGCSVQKVEAVIKQFELFQIDKQARFFSLSLIARLQKYLDMSEQAREAVNVRWEKARKAKELQQNNTNVIQPYYGSNTIIEKNRIEKDMKEDEREAISNARSLEIHFSDCIHLPKLREKKFIGELCEKFGYRQARKIIDEFADKGFKNLQTMRDALNEDGTIKPKESYGTNKGQSPRGTVDVDKHLREIEIARGETADVVSSRIHKRLG